jgi:hypothetical protein
MGQGHVKEGYVVAEFSWCLSQSGAIRRKSDTQAQGYQRKQFYRVREMKRQGGACQTVVLIESSCLAAFTTVRESAL